MKMNKKSSYVYMCALASLAPILLYSYYIINTSVDIPFQTSFFFLTNLRAYYDGTLTLADLTVPFGEHRVIGCNLIFLANAILFGLNTRIEHYIFFLCYAAMMVAIFIPYVANHASLTTGKQNRHMVSFFILTLFMAMINMSPIQYYDTGMGVQVIIGLFFSILYFLAADHLLRQGPNATRTALLIAAAFMAFILFGSGYSAAAIIATLAFVAYRCLILGNRGRAEALVAAVTFISLLLYVKMPGGVPLHGGAPENGGSGLISRALSCLTHPVLFGDYILVSLGSSIIGHRPLEDMHTGLGIYRVIGAVVLLLSLWGLYKFHTRRTIFSNALPALLIVYGLADIAIVCFGRWEYILENGAAWGTGAWYIYHHKLCAIGAFWIMALLLADRPDSEAALPVGERGPVVLAAASIIGIIGPQVMADVHMIRTVPYIYRFTAQAVPYAYFPDLLPGKPDETSLFLWPVAQTRKDLAFLRAHNLGPYRPSLDFGHTKATGELGEGWYGDGWIGASALGVFKSGSSGEMTISTFVTSTLMPDGNGLEVFVNGTSVYKATFAADQQVLHRIPVPPNTIIGVKIQPTRTMSPKEAGLNGDTRELGMIVQRLDVN
ncbi:hypothetical protein [Azospirillum sp. B4]|uniref:hypothetical protein n=1 Tax=Azospirillum sp. B4 TaxID=95605 RepID=UPI0011DD2289|nr:hypothetical protein [Azospirillum sp. B4]